MSFRKITAVILVALMMLGMFGAFAETNDIILLRMTQQDNQLVFLVKSSEAVKASKSDPRNFSLNVTGDNLDAVNYAYRTGMALDEQVKYYYTILYQCNMKNGVDSRDIRMNTVRPAVEAFQKTLNSNSYYRFIVYNESGLVKSENSTTKNSYLTGFTAAGDWDQYTVTSFYTNTSNSNPLYEAYRAAVEDCVSRTQSEKNAHHVIIAVTESNNADNNSGVDALVELCKNNNVSLNMINVGGSSSSDLCVRTGGISVPASGLKGLGSALSMVKNDAENLLFVYFRPDFDIMNGRYMNLKIGYNGGTYQETNSEYVDHFEQCSTTPTPSPTPVPTPTPTITPDPVTPTPTATFRPLIINTDLVFTASDRCIVYEDMDESSRMLSIMSPGESRHLVQRTIDEQWGVVEDERGEKGYVRIAGKGIVADPTPAPTATPTPTPTPSPVPATPTPTVTPTPTPAVTVPPKYTATPTVAPIIEQVTATPTNNGGLIKRDDTNDKKTDESGEKTNFILDLYNKLEEKMGEDAKWLLGAVGLVLIGIIVLIISLIVSARKHKKRGASHSSSVDSYSGDNLDATVGGNLGETMYTGAKGTGTAYEATTGTTAPTEYSGGISSGETQDPFFSGAAKSDVSFGTGSAKPAANDADDEKTFSEKLSGFDPDATVREEKHGMPILLHWEFKDSSRDYEVELVEKLTIGRGAKNDVVIDEKSVSRSHAVLTLEPDGMYISDVGSTYGTKVNGEPAGEHAMVKNGDVLLLGDSKLTITIKQ